jgi:hypothetical protein
MHDINFPDVIYLDSARDLACEGAEHKRYAAFDTPNKGPAPDSVKYRRVGTCPPLKPWTIPEGFYKNVPHSPEFNELLGRLEKIERRLDSV